MIIVDDFGLNKKVNQLVLRAFKNKVINGAAILVNCEGSKDALNYARISQKRGLDNRFGIHINFSEGKPILSADKLPTLIDKNGNFFTWKVFVAKVFLGQIKKEEIIKEVQAQIEKYQQTAKIDFINSHHHLHLLPSIAKEIAKLMKTYKINQIRCPKKSWLNLKYKHLMKAFIIQLSGKYFQIDSGCFVATYLADLDWVGLNSDKLKLVLKKLPDDCEVICHPHPYPSTLLWLINNKV